MPWDKIPTKDLRKEKFGLLADKVKKHYGSRSLDAYDEKENNHNEKIKSDEPFLSFIKTNLSDKKFLLRFPRNCHYMLMCSKREGLSDG